MLPEILKISRTLARWPNVFAPKFFEETGLTASAGIAPNKFLAKIASDWRKPNGQFVLPPQKIMAFLESLPLGKIPGVGKVTLKKMNALGNQNLVLW